MLSLAILGIRRFTTPHAFPKADSTTSQLRGSEARNLKAISEVGSTDSTCLKHLAMTQEYSPPHAPTSIAAFSPEKYETKRFVSLESDKYFFKLARKYISGSTLCANNFLTRNRRKSLGNCFLTKCLVSINMPYLYPRIVQEHFRNDRRAQPFERRALYARSKFWPTTSHFKSR